ncbi:hypothetical protein EV714DRAFT_277718 [Schizophyllum commune]
MPSSSSRRDAIVQLQPQRSVIPTSAAKISDPNFDLDELVSSPRPRRRFHRVLDGIFTASSSTLKRRRRAVARPPRASSAGSASLERQLRQPQAPPARASSVSSASLATSASTNPPLKTSPSSMHRGPRACTAALEHAPRPSIMHRGLRSCTAALIDRLGNRLIACGIRLVKHAPRPSTMHRDLMNRGLRLVKHAPRPHESRTTSH